MSFLVKAEALIDQNAERLASHALVKFVILVASFSKHQQSVGGGQSLIMRHRELLLRKLRNYNPEGISETRLATQLLLCLSQLDNSPGLGGGDLFKRFLGAVVKMAPHMSFPDISRSFRALKNAVAAPFYKQLTHVAN
jgi:hypothetical protein